LESPLTRTPVQRHNNGLLHLGYEIGKALIDVKVLDLGLDDLVALDTGRQLRPDVLVRLGALVRAHAAALAGHGGLGHLDDGVDVAGGDLDGGLRA